MRKEINMIINQKGYLHFCKDINGIPRSADVWFALEESKTLFENTEQLLVRLGEAHNLTSIEKLTDMDYRITYNIASEEDKATVLEVMNGRANLPAYKEPIGTDWVK